MPEREITKRVIKIIKTIDKMTQLAAQTKKDLEELTGKDKPPDDRHE